MGSNFLGKKRKKRKLNSNVYVTVSRWHLLPFVLINECFCISYPISYFISGCTEPAAQRCTAWKVSVFGVSGPYFPAFGLITEIYRENLRIQTEFGKIRTKKTPTADTFYGVCPIRKLPRKVLQNWQQNTLWNLQNSNIIKQFWTPAFGSRTEIRERLF